MFAVKLAVCFVLWTLYSYSIHVVAHMNFKWNFLRPLHLKHHSYRYSGIRWPPLHDYFFWFGTWKGTLDVWITFTLPLLVLWFFEREVATVLLAFHYIYEVFLSRDILDHNPNIVGKITNVIPIGAYHYRHHSNYKCNYSFYICLWDHLFGTFEKNPRPANGLRATPV
jgi:sterol desaturase/sphingolipid hydroxylase (fatty acid hydroxylase superfamily)